MPFFFLYTAELLNAFLQLPLLQTMLWFGKKGVNVLYSYEIKCMSYWHSGFPVKLRRNKHTGFEEVKIYYDLLDKKSYGCGFNDRYRAPLERLNPLPKSQYQIVPEEMLFNPQYIQNLERMYGKELLDSNADPRLLYKKELSKFFQTYKDNRQ